MFLYTQLLVLSALINVACFFFLSTACTKWRLSEYPLQGNCKVMSTAAHDCGNTQLTFIKVWTPWGQNIAPPTARCYWWWVVVDKRIGGRGSRIKGVLFQILALYTRISHVSSGDCYRHYNPLDIASFNCLVKASQLIKINLVTTADL